MCINVTPNLIRLVTEEAGSEVAGLLLLATEGGAGPNATGEERMGKYATDYHDITMQRLN